MSHIPEEDERLMHLLGYLDCAHSENGAFCEAHSSGSSGFEERVIRNDLMENCDHTLRVPDKVSAYVPTNLAKILVKKDS